MRAPERRSDIRRIATGFLLMLCSGFGQTYFIAIFAGYLKTDLDIADSLFGGLYSAATLASATLLIWAGQFADRFSVRRLGIGVIAGLALTALAMAYVASAGMLVLVLFGLRFFGQGLLPHLAMTAMGRWFDQKRGRAVSIAALGLPASEAVFPLIAVTVIGLAGWRLTWVAVAIVLIVVSTPMLLALLRREHRFVAGSNTPAQPQHASESAPVRREWTRADVLRSPVFFALLPGVMGPPFILTGVFFNQVNIVELKDWPLSWFAASFAVLAGMSVLSALAAGWIADRIGARRLLPGFLLPLALGLVILAYATGAYALPVFMALAGMTLGSVSTVQGALWPELYGSAHLGAIRALATAGMVFATALSPALVGILLDAGVTMPAQLVTMAVYCLAAALGMGLLMPRLNHLAAG